MEEIIIDMPTLMEDEEFCYEHRAQYYETDQMGIVHHSNYIRWMEEARIAYMEFIGLPYKAVEDRGVLIPVLSADCEYKSPVRFDEVVKIYPEVSLFNGIRMQLSYRMVEKASGRLCTVGHTGHCFTTPEMKPLSLKKFDKAMYDLLAGCLAGQEISSTALHKFR